ncbi:MAG: hypothetical protein CMO01_24405 [Thalassobius sp.]|nr:hypothetical protein [Thalassovita sp.]
MKHKNIAERINQMANNDLKLRNELIQKGELGNGYNKEMEELHNHNSVLLDAIIDEIGYPTIDLVGEKASDATWLIIQHSIGNPAFMRKCKALIDKAVSENKAKPENLAYLTDRIAVLEDKPQLYGTQFDWDENNELNPNQVDDLTKVDERRKAIGFNSLQEQTAIMRQRVKDENQSPPTDHKQRKAEMDKWRKAVGWID